MKIAVCIRRVPSTETTVKVAADGKTLDPAGVEYIVSPFDEIALEEGLRVKEKLGAEGNEVIAVTVGPAEAATTLRTCLAMGADKAILLKDDKLYQRAPYEIAQGLSAALKELAPDIIFFGKQAVDDDNSQVPTITAQLLNLPFVGLIVKLDLAGKTATVQREIDGGKEVLEVVLPAVFSAQKGLNEPRYPSLKGIMAAKKKPMEEKAANITANTLEVLKMEYPPSRPPGKIVGKGVEAVPELVKLLKEEAKII
ncbi:MAG: electron transfer flavoprotein subunit beta/FixA family protein [Planctomycetes bacterium]|nr:electron transfer flavoprotein subunit beta/FixA family protein [Planctomycetota bacterium]